MTGRGSPSSRDGRRAAQDREWDGDDPQPDPDDPARADVDVDALREAARTRIRQAAASGDYDGLLAPGLWRLFDAAASATGFGREIGALRFAMARLLAEEEDPRHLATHLARVTTTIIRATQAQQLTDGADDVVRAALLAALDDLEIETEGTVPGRDDAPAEDDDEEEAW